MYVSRPVNANRRFVELGEIGYAESKRIKRIPPWFCRALGEMRRWNSLGAEMEQEANREVRRSQVVMELACRVRRQDLGRLGFHNHLFVNDKVEPL